MHISELKKIAVIGAGDMGHGIAQAALMAGYPVNLCDIKMEFVERGRNRIYDSLEKLTAKGKFPAEQKEKIRGGMLQGFDNVADAVRDVDFVIEVVPEKLEIKLATIAAIDAAVSEHAVIASNTSTMSISRLAQATKHPERFVGTHYFNPVVLMRLVEVIKGDETSDETAQFALDYVKKIGKLSIFARKDTPGFIANRIAAPVIVYNGLQLDVDHRDPMDIDLSMMKIGQKMGPMELADYTGVDVMSCCLDYYHEHLSPEYAPSKAAQALLDAKHYGRKSGAGYYDWPEKGRPQMDEARWTGTYDPNIPFFIQANECCKLVEDGVCSYEDCDAAMVYGYNTEGPIAYIQKFEPSVVAEALQKVADTYHYSIFEPTASIRSGAYRR